MESFKDPGKESFFAGDVEGEKYIGEWIARDYPFSGRARTFYGLHSLRRHTRGLLQRLLRLRQLLILVFCVLPAKLRGVVGFPLELLLTRTCAILGSPQVPMAAVTPSNLPYEGSLTINLP